MEMIAQLDGPASVHSQRKIPENAGTEQETNPKIICGT